MSKASAGRRQRVERNIYKRTDAEGRTVLEVGYRDSTGRQRWRTVEGGIRAARTVRDDLLARRGRGERVQPNPRLRFEQAAHAWLEDQVAALRPATQAIYRNAVENHLNPQWGRRRLEAVSVDDVARLVRDLRAAGKSEWTIAGVLKAANRIFKFAKRRLDWHGESPVAALDASERPTTAATERRRIYRGDELAQTLAAATEPYKTLFALASVTGARLSECLGLVWADLSVDDLDAAEVRFEFQVDRQGRRQPLKTEESRRTVEIPRQLAAMLNSHFLDSTRTATTDFVFSTATGRAIEQRNVNRALRRSQKAAVDDLGRPTFPILSEKDADDKPVMVPRGAVPNFHSFRHSAASEAIAQGDSAEEVSWQLGHRNSTVTRAVYVQEIKSAERK
ncbi:MAG: tyrosine-type recombinase/integrase, partial [Solirubrobacterales bacterium]